MPNGGAHEVKDHSLNTLLGHMHTSWSTLGQNGYLHLLQIHSAGEHVVYLHRFSTKATSCECVDSFQHVRKTLYHDETVVILSSLFVLLYIHVLVFHRNLCFSPGLGPNSVLDDANVLDRLFRMRNDFGLKLGLSVTGHQQSATIDKAIEVRSREWNRIGGVRRTRHVDEEER